MYIGITIILCSVVYLLIVTYDFFSKKRVNSTETKVYGYMIIISLVSLVFEFLSIIFVSKYVDFYLQSQIVNRGFLICILLWTSLLTHYIYSISFLDNKIKTDEQKKHYQKLVLPFMFLVVILAIILMILPLQFYSQGDVVYSFGLVTEFLNLIVAGMVVAWLIFTIMNYKSLKNKKYLPVFVFIICVIITLIVRSINPSLLLINATISLVTVLMYHTIENPDLKMLHEMELARDEAEKANKHKSDFLSSMSHEIRTPLNAIVGLSDLNMQTTDINEIQSNNKDILNASNILLEIVGNVLDMSRIESGNVKIVDSEYNPYDIFNSVIKVVEYRYEEKQIKLNINIAPDMPKLLYGDHANIKKVMLNLLTNAVKYTNEGHVDLVINSVNKDDICRLIISVEDTGRGIKPENINKLFTKFNRLDEDRNTTTEGTGLGLAISKHVMELMGGSITVQSVYGSGSKFTVTLDQRIKKAEAKKMETNNVQQTNTVTNTTNVQTSATQETVAQTSNQLPNVTPSVQTNNVQSIVQQPKVEQAFPPIQNPIQTPTLNNNEVNTNSKKVLLIDDNKLNLKVASIMLTNYGFQVVESESGQDCLDRINRGEKYDILLADEMMPNMSGTEMLKKLKGSGYQVPIVVLTADVENNAQEKYISAGFDDYLKKPIERPELERVIQKFFK